MAEGLAGTGQTLAAYQSLIRSAKDHPTLKGWLRAAPALVLGRTGYRLIAGRGKGFHRSSADPGTPGPKIKQGIDEPIRSNTPP
jgi:hypothetical protein